MATYFPSPSNQRDVLLTPYPGDQKFASYSEPPFHPGNIMMYLNQASSMSYSDILSVSTLSPVPLGNSVTGDSQVIPRTQLGFPDGEQNIQCQGLALSLGTGMPSASVASLNGQYPNPGLSSFLSTSPPISRKGEISCKGDENNQFGELIIAECLLSRFSGANQNHYHNRDIVQSSLLGDSKEALSNRYLYEPSGFANTLLNSKYLKAAQQLLDEVANLWNALKQHRLNKHQNIHGIGLDGSKEIDGRSRSQSVQMSSDPGDSNTNSFCELSPAQRQELQNKKKKLLSMVDEVDRRYKQYYDQMQIVVSSFDMVAGCGAAEPYTALALQTISRHFRCLRDAITSQIQVTQRSLGEQDTSPYGQGGGIARLRYVDQQLKQHRALQQFGVMRHAWRPQRGLPETAVSILRAWLFEHFLHPYPKDSEKVMLAKETGLTRNQVANWFINARVRLWKPMVEEMYKEEFGESELNSQSSPENASKAPRDHSGEFEERREELQDSVILTTADGVQPVQAHESNVNGKTARPGFGNSAHRDNISGSGTIRVQGDQRPNVDDHSLYPDEIIPHRQVGGGSLMGTATTFDMLELGSFVDGSQVSLALELRHCERDGFPMSGGTNLRGDDTIASSAEPDSLDIQCLDPVKQHHRFDNSHMVYDFVV